MRLSYLFLILLIACGCANQSPKADAGQPLDLFEVERLATSAYENGDLATSEKHYLELAERVPQEAIHWFRLGNIYTRTQRPGLAIAAYRETVIRDPKFAKAWFNMGLVQLRQAANNFNQMQIYTDPDDPLSQQGRWVYDRLIEIMQGDREQQ